MSNFVKFSDPYSVLVDGRVADTREFDDVAEAQVVIYGGPHDLHTAVVVTEKHNCGARGHSWDCSCGSRYSSPMNGCWQYEHQRPEEGDNTLPVRILEEEWIA